MNKRMMRFDITEDLEPEQLEAEFEETVLNSFDMYAGERPESNEDDYLKIKKIIIAVLRAEKEQRAERVKDSKWNPYLLM